MFVARERATGRLVGLKALQKRAIVERGHAAMVMNERRLLARLACAHVACLRAAFQSL